MIDFTFYFGLGWGHIISREAADHILFIIALAAIYELTDWKKLLILITAFTVGHSLTLALSVYDVVRVKNNWVEFLIPVTIMATATFNVLQKKINPSSLRLNYFLALFFGLIHGLGFANTIRFMLAKKEAIGIPLFGFNVWLEFGQLLIVTLMLLCSYVFINKIAVRQQWWIWIWSAIPFLVGCYMAATRFPV